MRLWIGQVLILYIYNLKFWEKKKVNKKSDSLIQWCKRVWYREQSLLFSSLHLMWKLLSFFLSLSLSLFSIRVLPRILKGTKHLFLQIRFRICFFFLFFLFYRLKILFLSRTKEEEKIIDYDQQLKCCHKNLLI